MRLRTLLTTTSLLLTAAATPLAAQQGSIAARYGAVADSLIRAALSDSTVWERLAYMGDTFGPRFSGTENLEQALDWILSEMAADGLEGVRGQEVMVPNWNRGREWAALVEPRYDGLDMLGLGNSIATPPEGVTAPVLVVGSFEELERRAAEARGKIVLFDVPFTSYGETVQYRGRGAVAAARAGAVASLIRSVTPYSQQTPHTGNSSYEEDVPKIPHAAITVEDALMLRRLQDRGVTPVVRLYMEAQTRPDTLSRNVIAEIRGSERPDEVVVLGGHIDSWDVGTGMMDDGGGSLVAWEAVRLMKKLGLRPRRTVRVVLWTNEENGLRGAQAYADAHPAEDHVLAMESDAGVFDPEGFGFTGSDAAYEIVREIGSLLAPIESGVVTRGGGGADIGPLMRQGVPGMGLDVDGSRYFWYHHTDADTLDKLSVEDVLECVATMAVMAYVVADLPERLPR